MKSTICQIVGKLVLLLTAVFLYHDSLQFMGKHFYTLAMGESTFEIIVASQQTWNATNVRNSSEINERQSKAITNVAVVVSNHYNCSKNYNNSKRNYKGCNDFEFVADKQMEAMATRKSAITIATKTNQTSNNYNKNKTQPKAAVLEHISVGVAAEVEEREKNETNLKFIPTTTAVQELLATKALVEITQFSEQLAQHAATETTAVTEPQTQEATEHEKVTKLQQKQRQRDQQKQLQSKQQQVQPQTQQQQQQPKHKEQTHPPRQLLDTLLLPTTKTTITTLESHTKLMPAKKSTGTHLTTDTEKLKKFATKVPKQEQQQRRRPQQQQQQPQQSHQQQRQKLQHKTENANEEYAKPKQQQLDTRKQKRVKVSLQQQQEQKDEKKLQQQIGVQQLFNQNPTAIQQQEQRASVSKQASQWQPQQQLNSSGYRYHVGVLIPSRILDVLHVQQGFYNFLDFFHVNLQNVNVDFIRDDGLSGLIRLLEHTNYTTVVKTLNAGINLADDELQLNGSMKTAQQQKPAATKTTPNINNTTADFTETVKMKKSSASSNAQLVAYCHLAEQLSQDYNKTVLVWPCPDMKKSNNLLPSFEAISYAVKSIATKLNWTQVDIYVGDKNWGLPLAIASHLHIPYKIEIGEDIRDLHAQDKIGRAIIITADMNDASTLHLLTQLVDLRHTKVLLIDVVAASFNAENNFYKNLARINNGSEFMSNLLLLTVLSDKYRHFLKVAFGDNGIATVQNFRQIRRWKAMSSSSSAITEAGIANWPIHLDSSVTRVLEKHEKAMAAEAANIATTTTTTVRPTRDTLAAFDECPQLSGLNFVEICPNIENVTQNCVDFLNNNNNYKNNSNSNSNSKVNGKLLQQLRILLKQLCHIHPFTGHTTNAEQKRIASLKNFIDFFHFYDFIITNVRQQQLEVAVTPTKPATETTATNRISKQTSQQQKYNSNTPTRTVNTQMPKYDFIVLEVVRHSVSSYSGKNNGNNNNKSSESNTNNNRANSADAFKNMTATTNTNATKIDNKIRDNLNATFTNSLNSAADIKSITSTADSIKWRPLLILEQNEINLNTYITHSIQPGYDKWLLVSTAQIVECGAICWTIAAIVFGLILIIAAAGVAAGIALRNYYLRKRLSKGPNKIVLSAEDFVFPIDSRRVDEGIEAMLCCWLQQLQEFGGPEVDKPDLLKGSIGSLKNLGLIIPGAGIATATGAGTTGATANGGRGTSASNSLGRHNPALLDMRARYNGDLVQLKEIPLNGSTELKAKAMDLLVMAHGMRHENINPLIGWLSDPNRTAMVFDYCSRGSLQDVLIMDEIKLDWSFRLSLLTDLVRGMRYLHASPLRVHGTLTSRNCVVDARWVLKITDYGLSSFHEAQGLLPPTRTAKELLWTAPELLRSMKTHHNHYGRVLGTQMGDVYSFGIIMQEVVVRGEPYCMLSLSPDEIIAKIKKPPPLIRPSVSKGAAPPEAINIMRQCWAEQPDMRPDFNSVYERFKMLNHGRKVNFVDTMFQMLEKYSNNLEELIRERTEQLDIERKKTEQLLNRMLPSSVAEKLKMGLAVEPEEFSDVTIYFSDIVGFTTIAAHCSPVQVVDLLNDLYTIFDATINAYNVYKVETIGDAYMVVSGLPVRTPDHADQIATMALDLLHQSGRFHVKHLPGVPVQLRIGMHTGPCCAGVVGLTMPRYCLFGDTVNTASRMESTGSSWRIHMSQETRDRLETRGGYTIEPRGLTEIKGKGLMNTFWLLGKRGFDKPLPTPPPIGESHGLDESLIRNSITLKAQANKSRNSTNPSSSQSSSLAGESVEVKVEITPPTNADGTSSNMPNSYSIDSTSTNTISPITLCPEFPTKTPNASPQSRKMSELAADNLLTPGTFNRLPSSTGGSSSRLYKKIEEMMDLSSPYNHYKCLSPSESNLTQFYDGKYLYSGVVGGIGICGHAVGSVGGGGSGGGSTHSSSVKFDSKPGSSRLLRRQFSLDRDDTHSKSDHHYPHQHHHLSLQATQAMSLTHKSSMLDIPILHDNTSRSPKGTLTRTHKQNSTSIAQDLEKIEEIPLSPASSQHHSSLDSNVNRSPPSTVEVQTPPSSVKLAAAPMLSAPTSPAPSRTLNGVGYNVVGVVALTESPTTTDASTATTTASVNSNNTTPGEESEIRRSELTLNVETLLSR
ncbi:uncharacterized protein [Eurosta solidaginis]|uniref:uncharacterized protein n=1 Tax=Eurosta solidaginis TaxID=178769 RepID=UPI00353156E5